MATNPYVNKVVFGETTVIDISPTTAVEADVAQGKIFYKASGAQAVGTNSGGSSDGAVTQDQDGYLILSDEPGTNIDVEPLSVTTNGTYTAPTGTAYSPVTVNVSGGGGVTPAPQKQVNFIDYDGTILYSYTATEANALTSLPSNPSHDGLIAQGWNWTLQQIKSQLSAMPNAPVWIGQMYTTASGKTEIDVRFVDAERLSPYMSLAVNGTVSINWGDNSTADTVSGTSLTTQQGIQHTYPSIGDYTITVSVTSGSWAFYGTTTYLLLYKGSTANENRAYSTRVRAVRIGSNTGIGNCAFCQCYSLSSITIPNTVTNIGDRAFQECYGLNSLTLPSGITDTGNYLLATCNSLSTVSLPWSVTSVGTYLFNVCSSLPIVTIPSGITDIGAGTFRSNASLTSITIPSGVTSIGTYGFQYCYALKKLRFEPQTPPTLAASTVFQGLPTDCVISVPTGKKSAYTGASNYPSSSTYTYIEE